LIVVKCTWFYSQFNLSLLWFQDLYLGSHCCYDFSSNILGRKCCDGDGDAGVIVPGDDLDEDTVAEVNESYILLWITIFHFR
jgi:hypothetical protein